MSFDSNDILNYLETPLCKSKEELFNSIIDEIALLEERVHNHNELKWKDLSIKRVLCSNTMMKASKNDLEAWDRANVFVNNSLGESKDLSFQIVSEVNSLFTSSHSQVRNQSIYGGDKEFIKSNFLDEGIKKFETLIKKHIFSNSYEKAFFVYQWIVSLHPFEDGNGRTSRLCADYILFSEGKLPVCFETSMSSHVCQCLNSNVVNKEKAYIKFLKAVRRSYKILLNED